MDDETTIFEADINGYYGSDKGVIAESLDHAKAYVEDITSENPDRWEQVSDSVWICYNDQDWVLGRVYERNFGGVWERGYRD